MENRIVLVTGATDGIGRQTALELARLGATVIMHGRSPERAQAAVEIVRQQSGSQRITWVAADFASLVQVRLMADAIKQTYAQLHVLINNAGVYTKTRELTADGYELTLGVNHLAHFLLTNLLLERLKASAPARVVTVSSSMNNRARLDFDNLQLEQNFSGPRAYGISKLCNVLFAYELAERLMGSGVTSTCLHPGTIDTKMLRTAFNMSGDSVEAGARTAVYLASSPDAAAVTGQYFDAMLPAEPSPLAHDRALRQRLWQVSEQLVGLA